MKFTTIGKTLGAVACGLAYAFSAHAAETTPKKSGPASVSESAPAETGMEKKGKAGKATMPTKGPSASNESAPSKKEKPGPLVNDNKNMPNPKTPSASNESAPAKKQ